MSVLSITPDPLKNALHKPSSIIPFYLSMLIAIKKLNISLCASNSPLHIFVYITFVIWSIKLVSLYSNLLDVSDYNIALLNRLLIN